MGTRLAAPLLGRLTPLVGEAAAPRAGWAVVSLLGLLLSFLVAFAVPFFSTLLSFIAVFGDVLAPCELLQGSAAAAASTVTAALACTPPHTVLVTSWQLWILPLAIMTDQPFPADALPALFGLILLNDLPKWERAVLKVMQRAHSQNLEMRPFILSLPVLPFSGACSCLVTFCWRRPGGHLPGSGDAAVICGAADSMVLHCFFMADTAAQVI